VEQLQKIERCPLCGGEKTKLVLEPKDLMLTQETFPIVSCETCDFWFTNPIPTENVIGNYYKHESYVSHTSSNKGIVNKIYNLVRKRTIAQKVKLVANLSKGQNVFDYGCGTGHFLNACKEAGMNVVGLEPDEDARKFAETNFGLRALPTSSLDEIENASLDKITMWHVLEHVYHLQRDLTALVSKLKKGGYLIIAVPNRNSFDAKHYGSFWAAYDVPRHLYHFVEKDIKLIADQHEMILEKTLPMKWDAFYVSMLSEKYKKGNLVSAVLTGLKSNRKAKNNEFSSQIYVLKKK
jgi:2-polyprenyl-3-methyl-5-hydroxy-6-metoxy-1,4-benzoquinol methylase